MGIIKIIFCYWILGLLIAFMGCTSITNIIDYWNCKSWVLTSGYITKLDAQKHDHGTKNTNEHYLINAIEYSYSFNDRLWTGNKLKSELIRSKGNDADKYKQLKAAFDTQTDISVLVNPKHPEQAVLFREISFDTYFYLGLCTFWFSGMIYAIIKKKITWYGKEIISS